MRTSSDSDRPSFPSPSSGSIISIPDMSDEDFEIILMPSASASPASNADTLPSMTTSFGSLSLGADSAVESEEGGEDGERAGHSASRPRSHAGRTTSPTSQSVGARSAGGNNTIPDETEAEVEAASVATTRAVTHRPSSSSPATSRRSHTPSILSASDARESIDSFLTDPSFTSDKANMLRLWQSLCVELGLVALEELEEDQLPSSNSSPSDVSSVSNSSDNEPSPSGLLPPVPHFFSRQSHSESDNASIGNLASNPIVLSEDEDEDEEEDEYGDDEEEEDDDNTPTTSRSATPTPPTTSRSATPTQTLPPLPTTLTQASRLLHARAHVNIGEYLAARADPARQQADVVGKYADLVYVSSNSLMRQMRKEYSFVPLNDVKREWLQPLLKDFGFKRRREV